MRPIRRLSLFNGRLHQQRPKRQVTSLRIANVTQDMEGLNASFESARPFAIYDAIRDAWTFVQAAGFEESPTRSEDTGAKVMTALGKDSGVRQLPARILSGNRRAFGGHICHCQNSLNRRNL
jgi:hypothetical protein